jgi:hypothetical protein
MRALAYPPKVGALGEALASAKAFASLMGWAPLMGQAFLEESSGLIRAITGRVFSVRKVNLTEPAKGKVVIKHTH